jgi:acyl-CoA synthetase (NDP forming)
MRNEVQGFHSFATFQSLPEVPDVAIIAVPGDLAVQAVAECAEAGVALSIVMSSGFGESDAEGKLQEQAMKASARAERNAHSGPEFPRFGEFWYRRSGEFFYDVFGGTADWMGLSASLVKAER